MFQADIYRLPLNRVFKVDSCLRSRLQPPHALVCNAQNIYIIEHNTIIIIIMGLRI